MTPGNVEFVDVVCSMTVWIAGTAGILAIDERLMTREQHDRDWLPATRGAAVLGAFLFGVLYAAPALILHFARTRESLVGSVLGLGSGVALFLLDMGVQSGAEAAIRGLGL